MNVAINAMRLAGQPLGVARYIEHTTKHWPDLMGPSDRVRMYLREPLDSAARELHHGFELSTPGPRLTGALWENLVLARHARAHDVLFCPSYTRPLTYSGRSVVAIHSTNEVQVGAHPRRYRFTNGALYRLSARNATRVIVPSHVTAKDIETHYQIPADKIDVVPLGVDDAFLPFDDEVALRAARRRHLGADVPFILVVGKLSQRRNIPLLLEAFATLKRRERVQHRLLLFGPNHMKLPLARIAQGLGISDAVIQTPGRIADHRELVTLYNAADLYVNASLYEGFSLPLVEALACGVPAVTMRGGALAEIAGDAALLVDEPTAQGLSDALARALGDTELRARLQAAGPRRARGFRWEDTARRTWEILRRVAEA